MGIYQQEPLAEIKLNIAKNNQPSGLHDLVGYMASGFILICVVISILAMSQKITRSMPIKCIFLYILSLQALS